MADYKELLRKAIEALPESNGAARRAVYEKARGALVNQLRAIKPALTPRDINQHRLNLEDCIRLVEQEATEALLLGRSRQPARLTAPEPKPDRKTRGSRQKSAARPKARTRSKVAPTPAPEPAEPEYVPETANGAFLDGERDPVADEGAVPVEETIEAAPARPRSRTRTLGNNQNRPVAGRTAELAAAGNMYGGQAEAMAPLEDDHALVPVPVAPRGRRRQTIEQVIAAAESDAGGAAEKPRRRRRKPVKAKTAPRGTARRRKVKPVDDEFDTSALIDEINPVAAQQALARNRAPSTRVVPARSSQREAAAMRQAARPVPRPRPVIEPPLVDTEEDPYLDETEATGRAPEDFDRVAEDTEDLPDAFEAAPGVLEDDNPQAAIDRAIAALDREASGQAGYVDEDDELYAFGARGTQNERDGIDRQRRAAGGNTDLAGDDGYPVDEDDETDDGEDEFDTDDEPAVQRLQPLSISGPLRRPARPRPDLNTGRANGPSARKNRNRDAGFATELADAPMLDDEQGGANRIKVFLVMVVVLAVAVGGGGIWAWRAGFLDFAAPSPQPGAGEQGTPSTSVQVDANAGSPRTVGGGITPAEGALGAAEGGVKSDERLPSETNVGTAPTPNAETTTGELSVGTQAPAADAGQAPTGEGLPEVASIAGSQSILFEEQSNGAGPAPFSGSVDWTRGVDEIGLPVILGSSTIPARNLSVDILIRKNSDPALPASHLIEVNFSVTQSFVGGGIASLPGVLLKREERSRDDALVGASARVFDNSFLFALSSEPKDVTANTEMLETYGWLDLPLVYSTGRRAILSLEKGDEGQKIFTDVLTAWADG
ncbi:MAG: hypothetical protein GXP01_02315 [Alphaproteobacteria bacterium]|nr:hypothetical protein [Alphaproteobacteria bacterium]